MIKAHILLLLFTLTGLYSQAQTEATNELKITGKVKSEKTISLADLQHYPTIELNNINTSCSPKK